MKNDMPAKAPPTADPVAARLSSLGERLRAHRKHHKVSATTAAEAAGMSRVTLHRIERGEPSVTMGAYMSALDALGLALDVVDAHERAPTAETRGAERKLPASVRLEGYPQLKRLAWQFQGAAEVTPAEALSLYERNWRHIDRANISAHERALIDALLAGLGGGRLLV